MSRSRKSRKQHPQPSAKPAALVSVPPSPARLPRYLGAFACGVALTLMATFGLSAAFSDNPARAGQSAPAEEAERLPQSHYDLLAMTPDELGQADFALTNLLCAKGLPGVEELDIPATLATLDEWAAKVKFETERHLYRATDPRFAEHYGHSEARLRAEFIVQVLQEDCGVHYNRARIANPDFRNAADLFIHGMIGSNNGGTCASMPVLYTAIGHRLGYPMKLVLAHQHIFCRWDDGTERFNIEGSANGGVDYFPDEYYRTWPKPISEASIERGEMLKSLTPAEELSTFLLSRGICWQANKRPAEARAELAEAARLFPQCHNTRDALRFAVTGSVPRRPTDRPPVARSSQPNQPNFEIVAP